MNQKHIGSEFDDFLREEGVLEATEAAAIKRVIAYQVEQEMKRRRLSKREMASRMKTSRAAVDRLLDPANTSVTLSTLGRAATALGKQLKVDFTPIAAGAEPRKVRQRAKDRSVQRLQATPTARPPRRSSARRASAQSRSK